MSSQKYSVNQHLIGTPLSWAPSQVPPWMHALKSLIQTAS